MTPEAVMYVANLLIQAGGRPYLVGGVVRDFIMSGEWKPDYDYDIEVFGLEYDRIIQALQDSHIRCTSSPVGRNFKTVTAYYGGYSIDLSLPRKEIKSRPGRTGFDMVFDPGMSLEEACKRRDFRMNSAMWDLSNNTLVDLYGAAQDITNKVIDIIDPVIFQESPERPLRGLQFISRFGFNPTYHLVQACIPMREEYWTLSKDLVWKQWYKWASGKYFSDGLRFLKYTKWLDLYPELVMMGNTYQSPEHHPEGDVWEHTIIALDKVALANPTPELVLATLLHDVGKIATTYYNFDKHKIVSYGHDDVGAMMADVFLYRIGAPNETKEIITEYIKHHMTFINPPSRKTMRGLMSKLVHIKVPDLIALAHADGMDNLDKWETEYQATLDEYHGDDSIPCILQGRDLIEAGFTPSPQFGIILADVYARQIQGIITDYSGAISYVKNRYSV